MLLSRRSWQLTEPKQAIKMGDLVIEEVVSTRCVGVQIDNALKWDHHVRALSLNTISGSSLHLGKFPICRSWGFTV